MPAEACLCRHPVPNGDEFTAVFDEGEFVTNPSRQRKRTTRVPFKFFNCLTNLKGKIMDMSSDEIDLFPSCAQQRMCSL